MFSIVLITGFVTVIAVLNLALGAVLAAILGRGPLAWREGLGARLRYRFKIPSRPEGQGNPGIS